MFKAIEIRQVEAETIVGHDHEGNPMIVKEGIAIREGMRVMWVTPKTYEKLKATSK